MAKTRYIDREGNAITEADWKKKQADAAYAVVKEYDNGVVRVTLKWNGRIAGPDATSYPDYWPVFVLLVKNYKADGTLVNDPADNDQKFPNEEAAIKAYEAFLTKWTESQIGESGEFQEEGNVLTPPPPPDPNKPQTEVDIPELGGVGAW